MHNPHINIPRIEDKHLSSEVHISVTNLRFLLKDALTDEVAAELGKLIQRSFSAGYGKGHDDAEYDNREPYN